MESKAEGGGEGLRKAGLSSKGEKLAKTLSPIIQRFSNYSEKTENSRESGGKGGGQK